jgi:hypothetical protein
MWSDQTTQRFGFKTHADGAAPGTWSADEVPASQSAQDVGRGMADDHINLKVGGDGTLYASVKTSYDTPGTTELALLVRRRNGNWDDLYEVAQNGAVSTDDGTLPIVLLNEALGRIRVIYTSRTNGGDILYQESPISKIAFGAPLVLISGTNNNATSIAQNFTEDVVVLASNETQVVGVLASDVVRASAAGMVGAVIPEGGTVEGLVAYPNPFSSSSTLSFTLPADGAYSVTVYEGKRLDVVYRQQGNAQAGARTLVQLDSSRLPNGIYFARLQTSEGDKTIRVVVDK